MAKNDFSVLYPPGDKLPATHQYIVAKGTTSSINAGEFVLKPLGNASFATAFTASQALQPEVGTDYIAGLAMSTSTETTTASGVVEVMELTPNMVFLGNPKTASTFNSQAKYNGLVGARVHIDVTSGVHTVLATDFTVGGLVIEYLDISTQPAKVAFKLRGALFYGA